MTTEQQTEGTVVEFKGKTLDLSKALPLKLRDWKVLERKGASSKQFEEGIIGATSIVVWYVLNKVDGSITQDDVDDMDLGDPVLQKVSKAIGGQQTLDRPIST